MRYVRSIGVFANHSYDRMKHQRLAAPVITLAEKIHNDNITTQATVLAYNFFFALPAATIFLVTALAYLPVDNLGDRITEQLTGVVPADAIDLLNRTIDKALERGTGKVSLLFISFLGAIYGMTNGYSSLIAALNSVFGLKEERSWYRVKLRAFLLSVLVAALMLSAFSLLIVAPSLADALDEHQIFAALSFVLRVIRWPAILLLVLAGMEISYRLGPCRPPRWGLISPGTLISAAIWILSTYLFGIYVNNFGSYDKVYGTLGAVIALITWIWISCTVFLTGGAINALWYDGRQRRHGQG